MYFASNSKLNILRSILSRLPVPGSIANTGFLAEYLEEFSRHLVGPIEVLSQYRSAK